MAKTMQLLTARCGKIRPDSGADYLASGGFSALKKAMDMAPMDIINEVIDAKLLGRGGASYPAGKKWKQLYEIEGSPKYIVCNADEGEPGTFKDKVLLEKDPLSIIEGMAIAGYVFDSHDGYIYIRGEYREIRNSSRQRLTMRSRRTIWGRISWVLTSPSVYTSFPVPVRISAVKTPVCSIP